MSKQTLRIVLIMAFLPFLGWGCRETRAQELLKKCKQLEIGMTRDQVDRIMGKPSSIEEEVFRGCAEVTLAYTSPRRASERTSCVIEKKTGLVIEVRCGEGYRLTQEGDKCGKLRTQMPYDEVIRIMGEPDFIEQAEFLGHAEKWLYFISPRHPQRVTKCVIDKNTGLLIGVYCD